MAKIAKRDISPILSEFRALLMGRKHQNPLRFSVECADRDQQPPNIPPGPAHKLSANYYVNRDPRSEVEAPLVLDKKLISSGENEQITGSKISGVPTPGQVFKWGY